MALKTKPVEDVRKTVPLRMIESEGNVQLNVEIPKQMRKALKVASAEREMTINAIVIQAIARELGSYENTPGEGEP